MTSGDKLSEFEARGDELCSKYRALWARYEEEGVSASTAEARVGLLSEYLDFFETVSEEVGGPLFSPAQAIFERVGEVMGPINHALYRAEVAYMAGLCFGGAPRPQQESKGLIDWLSDLIDGIADLVLGTAGAN